MQIVTKQFPITWFCVLQVSHRANGMALLQRGTLLCKMLCQSLIAMLPFHVAMPWLPKAAFYMCRDCLLLLLALPVPRQLLSLKLLAQLAGDPSQEFCTVIS